MTDEPLDLDKHRGMAAQKAVDLRRALAEAENHAKAVEAGDVFFQEQSARRRRLEPVGNCKG